MPPSTKIKIRPEHHGHDLKLTLHAISKLDFFLGGKPAKKNLMAEPILIFAPGYLTVVYFVIQIALVLLTKINSLY